MVAVDKKNEQLQLRAQRVNTSLPLVFNVSFVVQARQIDRLYCAILDIASELNPQSPTTASPNQKSLAPSHRSTEGDAGLMKAETTWLHCSLFPNNTHGVPLKGLPSGSFRQAWYDKDLNFEQMVRDKWSPASQPNIDRQAESNRRNEIQKLRLSA